jgi:hypothetical protein
VFSSQDVTLNVLSARCVIAVLLHE